MLSAWAAGREVRFDATQVRAVLNEPAVTEVPGASQSFRGLFAWRERVVPLVSLAPERRGGVVVVLEAPGGLVAVELERVEALREGPPGGELDAAALKALVRLAAHASEVER